MDLEQTKKKALRISRKIMWIGLAVLLVSAIVYYVVRTFTVSDGSRTGTLFKISRKGIIFKTYEGQLHLGGSAIMTQQSVWDFSVKNGEVYRQMQQFEGKTVRLYYRQLVNPFPWQGDTDYIVYKAEPVQ